MFLLVAALLVTTIIVSHDGGNMLNTTVPTLHALREFVKAVDGKAELLLDGGVATAATWSRKWHST